MVIEICMKYPRGPSLKEGGWFMNKPHLPLPKYLWVMSTIGIGHYRYNAK
jgi:hypothetical protein